MKFLNNKRNLFFILIVFFIIIFLTIFIGPRKESDLCYNGVHNQGEIGIDCGGNCHVMCHEISRLEIEKTFIVNANNGLTVLVNNSNSLYGLSSFSYDIIGYNEQGEEVVRKTDQSYILPRQEKYLSCFDIEDSLISEIKSINIEIYKENWNKFSQFTAPNLLIINKKINETGENLIMMASGRLVNDSVYNIKEVNVVAIIFDETGELIATTRTNINDIDSKEKRDFKVTWPTNQNNVSRFEMLSEVNIFQEPGFVKEFTPEKVSVHYINKI